MRDPAIVWTRPARRSREQLLAILGTLLASRVEEAYLIGSQAKQTATEYSDIDLVLVCNTTHPWPDRATEFSDIWQVLGTADLLIYTPAEWAQLKTQETGFWPLALGHAVRVI